MIENSIIFNEKRGANPPHIITKNARTVLEACIRMIEAVKNTFLICIIYLTIVLRLLLLSKCAYTSTHLSMSSLRKNFLK